MILIVGALIVTSLVVIIGYLEMRSGKIKFGDLVGGIRDLAEVPGDIVTKPILAASLPLAALGIALVGAAIVLPVAITKVSLNVPVGGRGTLGVSGEAGRR